MAEYDNECGLVWAMALAEVLGRFYSNMFVFAVQIFVRLK
jgi:hypothetical protein